MWDGSWCSDSGHVGQEQEDKARPASGQSHVGQLDPQEERLLTSHRPPTFAGARAFQPGLRGSGLVREQAGDPTLLVSLQLRTRLSLELRRPVPPPGVSPTA